MVFFLFTCYPHEIRKLIVATSEFLDASHRSIILFLEELLRAILMTSSFTKVLFYSIFVNELFYYTFFSNETRDADPVFDAKYIGVWPRLSLDCRIPDKYHLILSVYYFYMFFIVYGYKKFLILIKQS